MSWTNGIGLLVLISSGAILRVALFLLRWPAATSRWLFGLLSVGIAVCLLLGGGLTYADLLIVSPELGAFIARSRPGYFGLAALSFLASCCVGLAVSTALTAGVIERPDLAVGNRPYWLRLLTRLQNKPGLAVRAPALAGLLIGLVSWLLITPLEQNAPDSLRIYVLDIGVIAWRFPGGEAIVVGWWLISGLLIGLIWLCACLLRPAGHPASMRPSQVLGCLLLITLGALALADYASLDFVWKQFILIVAWLIAGTFLSAPARRSQSDSDQQQEGQAGPPEVASPLAAGGQMLRGAGSQLAGLVRFDNAAMGIVKVLIGIALLIALSELTNIGKTIVPPFEGVATEEGPTGAALRDRVLSNLALIGEQIQPYLILPTPAQRDRSLVGYVLAGELTTDYNLVYEGKSEIEVAGFKLPLQLLVSPIQSPIRSIFGIRSVAGNLLVEPERTILTANVDDGPTWSAEFPPDTIDLLVKADVGVEQLITVPLVLTDSLKLSAGAGFITTTTGFRDTSLRLPISTEADGRLLNAGPLPLLLPRLYSGTLEISVAPWTSQALLRRGQLTIALNQQQLFVAASPPDSDEVISALTQELAFRILADSSAISEAGMTDSWPAYQVFVLGLEAWDRYGAGETDALSVAVDHYRAALRKDPDFALASYWLGIALQEDGQPGLAANAFRDAIQLEPGFIGAYNALAFHLWDFDDYYATDVGAIVPDMPDGKNANVLAAEAHRLWEHILTTDSATSSPTQRASALYGLCLEALDHYWYYHTLEDSVPVEILRESLLKSYSLCVLSARSYERLSADLRNLPEVRQAEAAALNMLGYTFAVELWVEKPKRPNSSLGLELTHPENDGPVGTQQLHDALLNQQGAHEAQGALPLEDGKNFWHCNPELFDNLDSVDDWKLQPKSPGLDPRAALFHLERALALAPQDYWIRCNIAAVELVLGNVEPMVALYNGSEAHELFAWELLTQARAAEFSDPAADTVAPEKFVLAMNAYGEAIKRNPTNIYPLNYYGYTLWQRSLFLGSSTATYTETLTQNLITAAQYASEALRYARNSGIPEEEVSILSTHAELLWLVGERQGALEALQQAIQLTPVHPYWNELRWELAQAHLCLSNPTQDNFTQAQALLRLISLSEAEREDRFYLDRQPDLLTASATCHPKVEAVIVRGPDLDEEIRKQVREILQASISKS